MSQSGGQPLAVKEGFSALDTQALVRELRALGRAWFDKAYELPGERLLLTLRVQEKGKWELLVAPGRFAVLRPSGGSERPDEPGRLGVELRRQLTGAPLLSVNQPEGERYLELAFGRGGEEGPALLALELFGQGNILVVRGGRIVALLHSKVWAGRTLRPGEPYVRPPPRKDPFTLSDGEVLAVLTRSRTDRVSTLAARLGLGGPLAEEVVVRAALDPRAPASTDAEATAGKLVRAMADLLKELADPPKGYLYRAPASSAPVDATPYPSRRWGSSGLPGAEAGSALEERERFSEAAAVYFAEKAPPPVTDAPGPEEQRNVQREELLRLRSQQQGVIDEQERGMREEQGAAQLLLSNYAEVEARLEAARHAAPEEGEVEIEIDGRSLRLVASRPIRESAQVLFDQAKRRLPKLEGARRALSETESRLRSLDQESASDQERMERRAALPAVGPRAWGTPRKKHFWFEKAPRWMVSSERLVAVAGRDARSNDGVVKRYLKERDIYIHADLQGAPSVVIKRPAPGQGEVGEVTLREVSQWAVACSKAWRAGLASADAFWVPGDAVSKAGASGEFVAKGSWVIHGTKTFERDLPLELWLGTISFEREVLLQVAPRESFAQEGGKVLWRILPGEEKDREQTERRVAQDLGISRERLQSLLPPGGLRAERA